MGFSPGAPLANAQAAPWGEIRRNAPRTDSKPRKDAVSAGVRISPPSISRAYEQRPGLVRSKWSVRPRTPRKFRVGIFFGLRTHGRGAVRRTTMAAVAGGKGRRAGNLVAAPALAGTVLAAVPPPVAARGVDVCARTSQAAAAIRSRLGLGGSVCEVTAGQPAGIAGRLQVSGPASPRHGDFDGPSGVTRLEIAGAATLASLPASPFGEMTPLARLDLSTVRLSAPPSGRFDDLTRPGAHRPRPPGALHARRRGGAASGTGAGAHRRGRPARGVGDLGRERRLDRRRGQPRRLADERGVRDACPAGSGRHPEQPDLPRRGGEHVGLDRQLHRVPARGCPPARGQRRTTWAWARWRARSRRSPTTTRRGRRSRHRPSRQRRATPPGRTTR